MPASDKWVVANSYIQGTGKILYQRGAVSGNVPLQITGSILLPVKKFYNHKDDKDSSKSGITPRDCRRIAPSTVEPRAVAGPELGVLNIRTLKCTACNSPVRYNPYPGKFKIVLELVTCTTIDLTILLWCLCSIFLDNRLPVNSQSFKFVRVTAGRSAAR